MVTFLCGIGDCYFLRKLLSIKDTFDANGQVKLDLLQTHLSREGRLEKSCALKLIRTAKGIFRKEPNLLRLEGNLSGKFWVLIYLVSQNYYNHGYLPLRLLWWKLLFIHDDSIFRWQKFQSTTLLRWYESVLVDYYTQHIFKYI